jgi:O-antigen/teichoic acid export membrane protein
LYRGGRERPRAGYWWSVVFLMGHLLGAAAIFTSLFTLSWLVSVVLHTLHRYHPFPDDMFQFVTQIELYLIYADSVLCGGVLLLGTARFCKQVMEVER